MTVQIRQRGRAELTLDVGPEGLVLGRYGGDADLTLEDDPALSRRHGRLWSQDDELWYEDLGSSSGSFLGGGRLSSPVRLTRGRPVVLGDTQVELVESSPHQLESLEGLELKIWARTSDERPAIGTGAVYEFVQGLLRSTSRELMHAAVQRIHEVVPAARRISLVAWPPSADGSFVPLGGTPPEGPVSLSLARFAVESGQALLLAEANDVEPAVGASVVRHGIRSAIYVPLMDGEAAIGVLCVDTPTPTLPFSPDDFQFIRALGQLLTTALVAEGLREAARQRELEVRTELARREALEAFMQIAAHDLKSPLSCIKLSAYMLGKLELPAEAAELLATIQSSGARAQGLIRTYLEISRVGGNVPLERKPLALARLVDEEVALLLAGLDEHAARPRILNRVGDVELVADENKLRQILANLLSNAVKYSPQGGEVTVEAQGTTVHVRDQGVGISAEDQLELFHQFRRVGDRTRTEGSGLGLWLVRALVEAHGGRIWVESAPGQGSTFSFEI